MAQQKENIHDKNEKTDSRIEKYNNKWQLH